MMRQGFTVWFTGLPSSGKTTLARMLQFELDSAGLAVELLDGDEIRQRLCKGLGFTKRDRDDNIGRIAFAAKLITRVGGVAIAAAISLYREARRRARPEIGNYEPPANSDVTVHTDRESREESTRRILESLVSLNRVPHDVVTRITEYESDPRGDQRASIPRPPQWVI